MILVNGGWMEIVGGWREEREEKSRGKGKWKGKRWKRERGGGAGGQGKGLGPGLTQHLSQWICDYSHTREEYIAFNILHYFVLSCY